MARLSAYSFVIGAPGSLVDLSVFAGDELGLPSPWTGRRRKASIQPFIADLCLGPAQECILVPGEPPLIVDVGNVLRDRSAEAKRSELELLIDVKC